MKTLAERINTALQTKGISVNALARQVGVSYPAMRKITKGETLNPKFLFEIADALDVPIEWLRTGRGEIDLPTSADNAKEPGVSFELLNVQAAAGVGYFNDDFPEPLSRLVFSEHWVREHLGGTGKAVKLISVKGDSMSPTFNHGDFLFVDTAADFYNGEGVYVFAAAGELRVKRLQSSVRGGMNVISDNRNYNAEYLPPEDWAAVKVCGRVVYRLAGERV